MYNSKFQYSIEMGKTEGINVAATVEDPELRDAEPGVAGQTEEEYG